MAPQGWKRWFGSLTLGSLCHIFALEPPPKASEIIPELQAVASASPSLRRLGDHVADQKFVLSGSERPTLNAEHRTLRGGEMGIRMACAVVFVRIWESRAGTLAPRDSTHPRWRRRCFSRGQGTGRVRIGKLSGRTFIS
ncbi:hypothetical protein SLE2022_338040 [Rubroshorea leprosula]